MAESIPAGSEPASHPTNSAAPPTGPSKGNVPASVSIPAGTTKSGDWITDRAKPLAAHSFPNQPLNGTRGTVPTLANLEHMVREYGIYVRYNCIKKRQEISVPGLVYTTDNEDATKLAIVQSLAALNGMPTAPVPEMLAAIGDRNVYNPAAEWILSRPWDGVDLLNLIYDTLTTAEGFPVHLKIALMYRWLLSVVAAALKDIGFKARGVLTLQGPQGIGKTSWISALIDDPVLREYLVKVDHLLDPSNKDSILGAIAHLIVELGELDSSFRRADVARLKGFLTSNADKIRRPYARAESEYQRRTVFCATVNESNFLVDNTGNSRWWTLPVVAINYRHGIDMQQLFAQLAVDFHAGKQWWLTQEEESWLEANNR